MKRKLWAYGIEDSIENETDAFSFIIWSLAKQNPRDAVWIEENLSLKDLLTQYAMLLLGEAWEPIKKS